MEFSEKSWPPKSRAALVLNRGENPPCESSQKERDFLIRDNRHTAPHASILPRALYITLVDAA